MILSEATEHIMMKSSPQAEVSFGYRSRRFSSVTLGVFRPFLVDFALRNGSKTPQKRLEERSRNAQCYGQRCILRCWSTMESFMGSTHVAREQGSCSHGCACSGPESGVQNIRGTITTLKSILGLFVWRRKFSGTWFELPGTWFELPLRVYSPGVQPYTFAHTVRVSIVRLLKYYHQYPLIT